MIAGEIHYGRVQPRYWPAILDAAREIGVDTIACYVMWDYHEQGEGRYDFSALHEFLRLVEQRGFKVFARPGPFFYAEWHNLGIPDHAVPYHKLHPEFQRRAAAWIAAAMNELRPYLHRLVTHIQADNEIDPMPHFWGEDQGFAAWLAGRYGTVDRLNAAWHSAYASFDEPLPWLAANIATDRWHPHDEAKLRDGCQYRYDLATKYARWVVGEYRRNGCDVPIVLNTWPGVDAQHWRDLAELADIYGIDPYPSNECHKDFRYFRERLRLLRAVTPGPFLAEFAGGIWNDMPDREYSPDHYRLTALTALASGITGWNWYMLCDRDNWHGAPINERGVLRPATAAAFQQAVGWARQLAGEPPPLASCAVTWSWRYHQYAQICKRDPAEPLLIALHEMGIEYDFVDVDREFAPPRVLLLAGEIEDPQHVWRYVEQGGTLVCFQRLPAECPRPDGTSHPGLVQAQVRIGDRVTFITDGPLFNYRRVEGMPITASQLPWPVDRDQQNLMQLAVGRLYTTGFVTPVGRGRLIVLGCPPSPAAVLALHEFLGIPIPARPLTPGVHATIRGGYLIVVNPGPARTAVVETAAGRRHVDLPRCSGVVLEA